MINWEAVLETKNFFEFDPIELSAPAIASWVNSEPASSMAGYWRTLDAWNAIISENIPCVLWIDQFGQRCVMTACGSSLRNPPNSIFSITSALKNWN